MARNAVEYAMYTAAMAAKGTDHTEVLFSDE